MAGTGDDEQGQAAERARNPGSLSQFCGYLLRLGALGFGGPSALAGCMQRALVESRAWIDKRDYDQGLARAQLSPVSLRVKKLPEPLLISAVGITLKTVVG